MHELSILVNIVDTVETFALDNRLNKVASITLQVGELSPVVPEYLEECYPAAVDRSVLLHDTDLKLEILPAMCRCPACETVFSFKGNKTVCPECGWLGGKVISGREFLIKEIEAC